MPPINTWSQPTTATILAPPALMAQPPLFAKTAMLSAQCVLEARPRNAQLVLWATTSSQTVRPAQLPVPATIMPIPTEFASVSSLFKAGCDAFCK